jgi:hypothetical protein
MQQAPVNLCYYSNNCKWSAAFINELNTTQWKHTFKFICVDPSPKRPQLPAWLKQVPTLVIAGEGEPRTDGNVMNWLSEMKLKISNTSSGGGSKELEGWNTLEDMSFSTKYSLLDADPSAQGNGGLSVMKGAAFSFLNGASSSGERSGQDINVDRAQMEHKSKKETMFDAEMENYKKQRDSVIPRTVQRE